VFHKVPREQHALAPNAHAHREHFPLDASLFYELSFSNFPLLYSSASGVTCPSKSGAEHRRLFSGRNRGPEDSPRTRYRPPSGGL